MLFSLKGIDHCHPPTQDVNTLLNVPFIADGSCKTPQHETWWVPIVQAPGPLSAPIFRIHNVSKIIVQSKSPLPFPRGSVCKVNSVRKNPSGEKRQNWVWELCHRGLVEITRIQESPKLCVVHLWKLDFLKFPKMNSWCWFLLYQSQMLSSYLGYSLGCSLKSRVFGAYFFHTKCNEWESLLEASKTTVKTSVKSTNCFGMI